MSDPNETENTFENELKEEYEKNLSIISCLKDFENILDENYTIPIKINIEDKFVAFKLIKNNIEYIEEVLLEQKPFESICLKIFNLLFLKERNLNYDNMEEKIKDFQLILKHLKNQYDPDEEKKYINTIIEMRNIKEWKTFLKLNYINYGGLALLIAVVLKYAKTKIEVSDFLIYILQKKHMNNFKVNFDLNKLNEIPETQIVNDFIKLFKNETEFFYLDIINDKIVKILLSPEITFNAIKKDQIKNENPSHKGKRKPKKKKKNKEKYQGKDNIIKNNESEIKEEEKKEGNTIEINESEIIEEEDNEEDKSSKDIKSEKEQHEEIQVYEDEKPIKREEEQKEPKKNNNKTELNKKEKNSGENSEFMGKEKKEISEESKEITKENLLDKLIIFEKEIEKQKNELNKTFEKQKNEIEKIKESSKLESKKMKNELFKMKGELEKVKADVNLIKSRGALKAFIDFFYKGYNLQGAKSYEEKFYKIANELNKYNDFEKIDIEIVNMLRTLLKESALKLSLGNFEAHNIDKSKPILSQLFKLIDPNGNYDKVEKRLKTIDADTL